MSQNLKSKNYLLNLEKADENNTKKRDELLKALKICFGSNLRDSRQKPRSKSFGRTSPRQPDISHWDKMAADAIILRNSIWLRFKKY
jgi:hypothetical protein